MKPVKPESGNSAQPAAGLVNETIKAPSMRVVAPTGEVLGVLTRREALEKAREFGLDLVCVSPNTDPVVCKIMDFGKHLYKLKKKAKKAKANQVVIEIKELKIRPNTDTHDLMTKVRQAKKFLEDGNKVKVRLRFRGRERSNTAAGEKTMELFRVATEEYAVVEKAPLLEGRFLTMILGPKADK